MLSKQWVPSSGYQVSLIPNFSGLATNTALTAANNKISSLAKKTDYDTKITEIEKRLSDRNHDEYSSTPEFNSLADDAFNERLAQANLITKANLETKL